MPHFVPISSSGGRGTTNLNNVSAYSRKEHAYAKCPYANCQGCRYGHFLAGAHQSHGISHIPACNFAGGHSGWKDLS